MANWMFEPPVSTPISRITASEASRIRWYSLSVSVWAGATVIESPVCTPIGSKFSIEQMMTTLSSTSRITSISYSFQPMIDSSISTSVTGDESSPRRTSSSNSLAVVGDGRAAAAHREAGPHDARQADLLAAPRGPRPALCTVSPRQTSRPIFSIACFELLAVSRPCRSRRRWRRSSRRRTSPARRARARSIARFRPVCPPSVGSSASGRSASMTLATISQVSGSM